MRERQPAGTAGWPYYLTLTTAQHSRRVRVWRACIATLSTTRCSPPFPSMTVSTGCPCRTPQQHRDMAGDHGQAEGATGCTGAPVADTFPYPLCCQCDCLSCSSHHGNFTQCLSLSHSPRHHRHNYLCPSSSQGQPITYTSQRSANPSTPGTAAAVRRPSPQLAAPGSALPWAQRALPQNSPPRAWDWRPLLHRRYRRLP